MKLLLYCTKAKPYLVQGLAKPMHTLDATNPYNFNWKLVNKGFSNDRLNGKIVAECDFEVEKIKYKHIKERDKFGILHNESWFEYKELNVTNYECDLASESGFDDSNKLFDFLSDYLVDRDGYVINIKNLHIFDEPRKLYDCLIYPKIGHRYYGCEHLSKAPQNMMYVELDDIKYILISIRPEWLCKILNGEKTIEVRKKVLKEMLNNE